MSSLQTSPCPIFNVNIIILPVLYRMHQLSQMLLWLHNKCIREVWLVSIWHFKYNLSLLPFLISCFTIISEAPLLTLQWNHSSCFKLYGRPYYSHCNKATPLVIKLYGRPGYSHCNKTTPPRAYESGVTMLVLSVTIHSLEPWDPKFFPTGLLHTSYYWLLFVCKITTLPISIKQQWDQAI